MGIGLKANTGAGFEAAEGASDLNRLRPLALRFGL